MAELITFRCTKCQHVLKIGQEKAGRKAKCPKCGHGLTVPDATPPDKPAKPDEEEVGTYGLIDEGPSTAPAVDLGKPLRPEEGEEDDDEDRPPKEGAGPKAQ